MAEERTEDKEALEGDVEGHSLIEQTDATRADEPDEEPDVEGHSLVDQTEGV